MKKSKKPHKSLSVVFEKAADRIADGRNRMSCLAIEVADMRYGTIAFGEKATLWEAMHSDYAYHENVVMWWRAPMGFENYTQFPDRGREQLLREAVFCLRAQGFDD